ncbi:MAG: condensation domain-containing protein, partial [Bacteroidota bacterium]
MDQQIENIYLLSPSQKRVWEATKELSGLHRQCKVTLHGDLDIDHLASCFKSLSDRYDILRIQIVESTEFKYPGTQLVEEPIFTVTKSLENDNNEAKPDNLQSLKLELSYTEEGKHVLAISAPSILMDTASLVSLVNEAFFYYHNGGFAVQESPIQYLQFAEWQNRMAKEPDEEALDFWHKMNLSEASKQVLSFEKVLLENGHSTYEFEELTLEPIFRDYLEDRDINLATYLFGVYAICLSSHLKNAQCVISYTTDERSYDDLLNAKGLISKPLPVQVDFSKELTWLPFMQEVDQQIEESIGWEEYLETAILEQSETEIKGFDLGFEYVSVDNNNGSYRIHDIVSYDNLFKVKLLISDYDDHLSIRLCYDKSRIDA